VLQRAAVLGRVFWDSAAIHLSRTAGLDEDEVQAMLEELRRREMILRREESSFAGTVEYVFRHAILRDVTYETIVPRQRRALHKSVGNWLLEQGGERAREHTALVAEHYERAGESTLAASQLQLAARSAISVGAFEEAIATLEKARGLVAERGDDPVRILVDCTLGEVLSIHGDLVRGRQVLLEALPAARRAGDKLLLARILGNLVRNCLWSFDHTSVHTYLDEAVPLAREIADDEMLVFMLRQSANSNLQDFERAQADIEESIEIAQRIADRKALSAGWNTKGNLHMTRQDWSEAHAAYDHSLELAKADGDLYAEQMMHSNKAICYAFQGRFDDGEREIKESLRQARVLKLGVTEAQAMEVQGFLELRRGKEREAEVLNHQALALYREHGIDPWSVLIILGVLEARKGDRDRGLAWIGAARKAAAGTWGPEGQPYVDVFWEDLRGPLSDEETQAKIAAGESLEVKPILDELLARPVER
jgi:tetratricopeptide (TPR) repeat protein